VRTAAFNLRERRNLVSRIGVIESKGRFADLRSAPHRRRSGAAPPFADADSTLSVIR
jgi:hypothetical protein